MSYIIIERKGRAGVFDLEHSVGLIALDLSMIEHTTFALDQFEANLGDKDHAPFGQASATRLPVHNPSEFLEFSSSQAML